MRLLEHRRHLCQRVRGRLVASVRRRGHSDKHPLRLPPRPASARPNVHQPDPGPVEDHQGPVCGQMHHPAGICAARCQVRGCCGQVQRGRLAQPAEEAAVSDPPCRAGPRFLRLWRVTCAAGVPPLTCACGQQEVRVVLVHASSDGGNLLSLLGSICKAVAVDIQQEGGDAHAARRSPDMCRLVLSCNMRSYVLELCRLVLLCAPYPATKVSPPSLLIYPPQPGRPAHLWNAAPHNPGAPRHLLDQPVHCIHYRLLLPRRHLADTRQCGPGDQRR